MANDITYLKGDATAPQGEGTKIIAHICNDVGIWSQGFVLALSQKWPLSEKSYLGWSNSGNYFGLGEIQLVPAQNDLFIANMIAQTDILPAPDGTPPIRYEALEKCLQKLAQGAIAAHATIHMPRIGYGLAGGNWEHIEPLIQKVLIDQGLSVFVYDLS